MDGRIDDRGHRPGDDPVSDVDFDSGDPKVDGDPFEQSFDDTGIGLSACEPHSGAGMKGGLVVVGCP